MAAREANPMALLRQMRSQTQGMAGFRFFHDHDPRVCEAVLDDAACAKIILTRNPVESYVSWKIAQETGQWKLTDGKNLKSAQVRFDAGEFERHLARLQAFQVHLLHRLQVVGQTAFYIGYDDIQDLDVLNGLAQFLGVAARLEAVDGSLVKQNPDEIGAKVANLDQMTQALARLDRFNLARTPNFEPRRNAAIPSFAAAGPLLYMPVKGGPDTPVRAWLGDVTDDFTQKTLRQWMRENPGHRSFTVVRDPLLRAHVAFQTRVLSGARADVWQALVKAHKVKLPAPGTDFASDAAYHDALLGFLRYVKLNLSGQTGQRVDAHWASQATVLQGLRSLRGRMSYCTRGAWPKVWRIWPLRWASPALHSPQTWCRGLCRPP
jgi:hypothetical protein